MTEQTNTSPATAAPAPADTGAAPVAHTETRVSTIVGDRLCVGCGFNLTGQPVFKESVYSLLIARCPECGIVAPMQEYPILGKWAARWASLAAAGWLVIILAGAFALSMYTFGASMAASEVGSERFGDHIASAYAASPAAGPTSQSTRGLGVGMMNRFNAVDLDWWRAENAADQLRRAGGFRHIAAAPVTGFWISLLAVGLSGGVIGSVAMLHASRRRAAILILLPVLVAAAIQISVHVSRSTDLAAATYESAHAIARVELGPILFALSDMWMYAGMIVGVIIGRPAARWLARTLLPPRHMSALGFLWVADGKPPPAIRRNQSALRE